MARDRGQGRAGLEHDRAHGRVPDRRRDHRLRRLRHHGELLRGHRAGARAERTRPPTRARAAARRTRTTTSTDFTAGAPDPHAARPIRRRPWPRRRRPTARSASRSSSNVTISFTEPVNADRHLVHDQLRQQRLAHAAVTSSGGRYHVHARPGRRTSRRNESCTVTVVGARTSPTRTRTTRRTRWRRTTSSASRPPTCSVCGDPATKIHDVQGSGAREPDRRLRRDDRGRRRRRLPGDRRVRRLLPPGGGSRRRRGSGDVRGHLRLQQRLRPGRLRRRRRPRARHGRPSSTA